MKFHSTRGTAPVTDLRGVALAGLASDGGLYLPVEWPRFSPADIAAMRGQSYQEIAFRVLRPFMQGCVPDNDLRAIIDKSYGVFADPDVTPLRKMGNEAYVLELFHGPTLAFKDVALQFLGHMFGYFLRGAPRRMTIIGATSGDTGSAAIDALANRDNIDVFILYPEKGLSDVQRKQMTCVDAPNVHALAVRGTFDDCQARVKALSKNAALRDELNISTVNSINLLRILAQIVYYFVAASRVDGTPAFVVPTGNFGDVFAGYAAHLCGLPVSRLVVASNGNDILTRFFATGIMRQSGVAQTLSPSMDIQVSSNFERLLFDLCDGDAAQVCRLMKDMEDKKEFSVTKAQWTRARTLFAAGSARDDETLATIGNAYRAYGYRLDPHTAVGVKVARELARDLTQPVICLATAHPAKFPDTAIKATGTAPDLPASVAALIRKPERTETLPNDPSRILNFIRTHQL